MQLVYRQVAAPQLGNAIAGISAAQRGIGQGISQIGAGLTALGQRREARQRERVAEQEARALENIKQSTLGATSPEAISVLGSQNGPLPIGASDFLFERQSQLLDDDATRASTEGTRAVTRQTDEGTRGKRILNDGAALELGQAQASRDFQREYSGDLLQIGNLASQGRQDEAQVLLDRVLGSAGQKYGSDVVIGTIDAMNARTRDGDTTRTQVRTNDLGIRQGEENLTGTRIQNQGNRQRNIDARRASDRLAAQQASDDRVQAAIGTLLGSAASPEDAYLAASRDPNLTPAERVRVGSGIRAITAQDPNTLDVFNPIDPTIQTRLDIAENNPTGDVNFAGTADFVRGSLEADRRRSSSFQIRDQAQAINPEGGRLNIKETFKELRPDADLSPQDLNRIEAVQRNYGLDDGEIVAIMDRSLGARGVGVHSFLPGGKRGDDRIFDFDAFEKGVETYAGEVSSGNLEARGGEYERAVARTEAIPARVAEAQRARARALQSGDRQAVARWDTVLRDLALEATFIEGNAANLESGNRQRPQTPLERFTDPFSSRDPLIDDILGITPQQEELRTERSLR